MTVAAAWGLFLRRAKMAAGRSMGTAPKQFFGFFLDSGVLAPTELGSGFLPLPGLDSNLVAHPGQDSNVLAPPELDSDVLARLPAY